MKKILIITILSAMYLLHGCTALQPFPNVARGGDTIALAVGSPQNMTRTNTTATFTSNIDGIPIDITSNIRSIFKLYADPSSKVYEIGSTTTSLVTSSGHEPWITIVAIDLPAGLTEGTGIIQFNTTAIYPDIGSHINDLPLSVEIVAGTGAANSFDYEFGIGSQSTGDLLALEPQPRAVFAPSQPSTACPCPDYAAIEVKATIPTSIGTLPSAYTRVLPADLTVETGSGRSVIHSTNGQDVTVLFLSTESKLKYYEAQFSIVLHSFMSFTGAPTINSVRYFDINGNEISGPTADYTATLQ